MHQIRSDTSSKHDGIVEINKTTIPISIAIVDDDPGIVKLIQRSLSRENYRVKSFQNGAGLIGWLKDEEPDLILLDYNLPDLSGEDIARELNRSHESVFFIVMTGFGSEKLAVQMMKEGALDYLVKDAHFLEMLPIIVSQAIQHIQQHKALIDAQKQLSDAALRLEKAQLMARMGSFEIHTGNQLCANFSNSMESLLQLNLPADSVTWDSLFSQCVDELDYPRFYSEVNKFIVYNHILKFEFRLKSSGPNPTFIQVTGHPMDSNPESVLVICRDVSETKTLQSEILHISSEERQRMGQEIHDGLCQHLAGMEAMIGVLGGELDSNQNSSTMSLFSEVRKLSRQATKISRDLAHGLVTYEIDPDSWIESIENVVQSLNHQGKIQVELEIPDNLEISDQPTLNALFRICQEALTNIRKHSQASEVLLKISTEANWLELSIEDNGKGFSHSQKSKTGGLGLHIMKYRAESVGGYFEFQAIPNVGTSVIARFPFAISKQPQ